MSVADQSVPGPSHRAEFRGGKITPDHANCSVAECRAIAAPACSGRIFACVEIQKSPATKSIVGRTNSGSVPAPRHGSGAPRIL